MQFAIGNKVKITDENAEGTVVSIQNDQIKVDVDGFDFMYKPSELILISEFENLTKLYENHIPTQSNIKTEDKPSKKPKEPFSNAVELGRVRGKRNTKNILEFDLHIHDLLVKHSHMSSGEMLNYQLDYAVNCLEEAIKKNEAIVVFIHGIGKGVLKVELHQIFKAYGLDFHDGFMQEYGYGATRVELR